MQPTRWDQRAFASLSRLVRGHIPLEHAPLEAVDRRTHSAVRAAARIDFGGGWTDTPPYSLERGGAVLNAAITLHDELPILAEARVLEDKLALRLESRDLETVIAPRYAGQILNYANPADPYALAKAALVFRGIIPPDLAPDTPIEDVLRPFGAGLHLTTATHIPRGSGLGTSSILAGALLYALGDLLGDPPGEAQLYDEVLCLEQMITTGGGWQDQVGGLVGGVKLVTSAPGLPQRIAVDRVALDDEALAELHRHLLVVYTGQRRLAKDLLRSVMGRWMARDPEMVAMLNDIGHLAGAMRAALGDGDLATVGELVGEHWQINKRMDPGCTNPFIDDLVERLAPYTYGAKLAGAGGGGFMLALARDADAAQAAADMLAARYPSGDVRVWPSTVAPQGIVADTECQHEEA
jgi:fucokinase